MRRWVLSKRDTKLFVKKLAQIYRGYILEYEKIEIIIIDDTKIYLVDGVPAFIELEGDLFPHLMYLLRRGYDWLPAIVVDEGAVKPISKGADLMRPGIVEVIGEFDAGATIIVVDEKNRFPIAVGRSLVSRQELLSMMLARRGRAIENMHHIGDKWWKVGEEVSS